MSQEKFKHTARIFDIQRWSLHDGPGIRTLVFLKGCPLQCKWCANPESQKYYNELVYFKDKCIACLRCVSNCPYKAISYSSGSLHIEREVCRKRCYAENLDIFPCTKECYSEALSPVAKVMTVQEVMHEVMKDEGIYRESEVGGVSVSGGEPAGYPEFVVELFKETHACDITTAMETCGHVPWENLEMILKHTDYLFFDLKAFDEALHREYMGTGNTLILENVVRTARFLQDKGTEMTVRIPIIPTLTEMNDFRALLNFINTEVPGAQVELMPYHRLGRNKYTDMGMPYDLMELPPCSDEDIAPFREQLEGFSFEHQR
jgi:pyruvate formate lyase activating enzyme